MKNRRSAASGKILDGRGKNEKFSLQSCLNGNNSGGDRNVNGSRVNVTVREQRDGALVTGLVGVVVNQFMQRGASRHRVQQQDKTSQQRGDNRLAVPLEMAFYELQTICF